MAFAAVSAPGAARRAYAANVEPVLVGGQATLTGGAVLATVQDSGAAWYNPAGLAGITGTRLRIGADTFMLRAYRSAALIRARLPDQLHVVPLSHTEILALPTALVFTRRVGDRVTFAVGLFTRAQDFISVSDDLWAVDQQKVTGAAGAGSRYTYNQRLALVQKLSNYYGGVSIGWQALPSLRLGATVFGVLESTRTTHKFTTDYEQTGAEELRVQSREDRDHSQLSLGLQLLLGLQWQPTRRWCFGLAVRSASLVVGRWLTGGGSWGYARVGGGSPLVDGGHGSAEGLDITTVGFAYPMRVYLGVARLFDWGNLAFDAELAPPLENEDFDVYYRFNYNFRLGARVNVSRTISLGAGAHTARSARSFVSGFPDARMDFYGGSLGLEIRTIFQRRGKKRPLVLTTSVAARYSYGSGPLIGLEVDAASTSTKPHRDITVDATFHEASVHVSSGIAF